MVRTGSSYLTQSDTGSLLFGLGDAEKADSIVVRWPASGRVSIVEDAAAGEIYQLTEAASL